MTPDLSAYNYPFNPTLPEPGTLVLDNTKRSCFRSCPRKFFLQHIHGLIPRKGSTALRYGSTWHSTLEFFYRHIMENGWTRDGKALTAGIEAGKATWDKECHKKVFFDDYRSLENCCTSFLEYLNHYSMDENMLQVLVPEETFSVPVSLTEKEKLLYPRLADLSIKFNGQRDLKVKLQGHKWIIEHKTTGQDLSVQSQRLRRSAQCLGYVWADREQSEDHVEGILVSFHQLSARKSKTTGEYGKPTINFTRSPQLFTDQDLSEWRSSFIAAAADLLTCIETNNWPMNHDSCYTFGACSYNSLCEQMRPIEELNTQDFIVEHWDVEKEE